ncbi:malto-oligosyltrehalose trehalohydrolase [Cereibacter sp. SYSU M97828]|nr:malto-oligosyltrehalose trehalohydrolase [Cereibacter flavus]
MPRYYSWGAEQVAPGRWSFALWSPEAREVAAEVEGRRIPLDAKDGWHIGEGAAEAGERYKLIVDGQAIPDPASRAQEGDVHSASVLTPPAPPPEWAGRPWEEAVIYELHLGLFTEGGTFASARARLPELAALGITAVEIMPVGQFPGRRGWGYDGVLTYAPHNTYGSPQDFRDFVAAAHDLGIMVLLDVVYNHFGPDGNWIGAVTPSFFDPSEHTPWGAAIAFDQPPVRRFFIENAIYWLRDFGLDGLRFDAVDQIRDPDFLAEMAAAIRAEGFTRPIHLTTEDNRNITALHHPDSGDYDGEWNDDYHHCIHVLLTGETHDYYASFGHDPMGDLCLSLQCGYVEQGQPRPPNKTGRGEPSCDLPWPAFVNFNQNHDQTGNRAKGERLLALADADAVKVAHGLLLLSPFTPLMFMGEEAGETAPFQFFADYEGELAVKTREGRAKEFPGFEFTDPIDPETYEACRPRADDPVWRDLTKRLLDFRHDRIVPLVKSGRAGEASVERTGPRSAVAEWPFNAGRLRIAVDFGDGSAQRGLFGMAEGKCSLSLWIEA